MPDLPRIRAVLVQALTDIQLASGRPAPLITNDTVPDQHLPGFKSMNWLETTIEVCGVLGADLDLIPWIEPSDGHHRTVGEVVVALAALLGAEAPAGTRRVADGRRA